VEKDGVPNVGLWDQRAAFEWVQKYIPDIGGDNRKVTTMGISAGAGSILHHLTAEGGTKDPLFQRSIIQSAGYATALDRKGSVNDKFKRIEEFAGCKGKGLPCLRALDQTAMRRVSEFSNTGNPQGSSGWDPVPDGKYIINTPALEIVSGRYWKNVDSLISGYALNEAGGRWFVDQSINTTEKFDAYARQMFGNQVTPGITKLLDRLIMLYPAPETPGSPFRNTSERVASYVADIGFNCHHRSIVQAWPDKTYTYQSSFWGGGHYIDQFTTFYEPGGPGVNANLSYFNGLISLAAGRNAMSAQAFQSYLVSEIVAGNPNTMRNNATIEWPLTNGLTDAALKGVLDITAPNGPDGFRIVTSPRLVKERCDFWNDVWSEMATAYASG
jgi:carboxylesterase type B